MSTPTIINNVISWDKNSKMDETLHLISEEPLSIRIQGKAYSVIMRTPGEEIEHVAGFCLSEGIVDTTDDIETISFCNEEDTNVVTVTVKSSRRNEIASIMDRRGFISQTSCGICGKELAEDLFQKIQPVVSKTRINKTKALACLEDLSTKQPLRKQTKASHAAAIYNADFELLSIAEDVGRHNALDKAIGKLFLKNRLPEISLLILSSRISYELVQKAARARIPAILSVSRPTSLAVELAMKLRISMACFAPHDGLYIFDNQDRFK